MLLVFLLIFPLALLTIEIAPVEYCSMQINAPEQLHLSPRSVPKRWRTFTGGTITEANVLHGNQVQEEHLTGLDFLIVGSPTQAFQPLKPVKIFHLEY
ncbi:hypothetical protein [Sphaerochaeta sp.]|uniref:hypothetical protein n=1 Tax=Sphaerochaeta sp. TaxID=1972642 RepID=UPI003D1518DE